MIIGIDEVGRGCWAGPLVVAAVELSDTIPGLADSKKLTAAQRERLARMIRLSARRISIAWISPKVVDTLGLSQAMRVACRSLYDQLSDHHEHQIIIDGSINYLPGTNATSVIKADATTPAVSAASIIAKVARDRYMRRISILYPHYGFERHVGYGTLEHKAALGLHGTCSQHRTSFKPIQIFLAP